MAELIQIRNCFSYGLHVISAYCPKLSNPGSENGFAKRGMRPRAESVTTSSTRRNCAQRKRLALLQCYLEEKPIYLFDEWAADQDPEYRKFFSRELLTKMKKQGKIIIAITHDDHYFDVADKILKLDMGKVEYIKNFKEINSDILTE